MAKVKKSESTIPLLTDLFVKMSKLFNDIYILRGNIVIPGSYPSDNVLGRVICYLEPKYESALKVLVEEKPCIYVPSVVDAKIWFQEQTEWEPDEDIRKGAKQHFLDVDSDRIVGEQVKTAAELESRVIPTGNKMHWWKCIGDDKKLLSTVFGVSGIFDMPIMYEKDKEEKHTFATLAKQLLPLVSEKNATEAFIGTTGKFSGDDNELLDVVLDCRFQYFRMYILYTIMILPWEPEKSVDEGSAESESE